MTPLNPAFRRLLRWFIPQLKNEELDRLDGLLALRHHLIIEKHIGKTPIGPGEIKQQQEEQKPQTTTDLDIDRLTQQANAILIPYKKEYKKVLHLWTARRKLALQQDKFLPLSPVIRLKDLPTVLIRENVKLISKYTWNGGQLLFPWVRNRLQYYFKTQKS